MAETADDQRARGSPQSLRGSQGASPREQTSEPSDGEGNVNVQIPGALYESLSRLIESRGFANVADYLVQILRDEVNRDEFDNGTTGYTQREIELIRRLLRDVECSD